MSGEEKIIGKVTAGSTTVYNIIQDEEKHSIVIRSVDNPKESIRIIKDAIPFLIKTLNQIKVEWVSKNAIKDITLYLRCKNARTWDAKRNYKKKRI